MFQQHLKTKAEDFEFYAMCHGAKPSSKQSVPSEPSMEKDNILFGDPEKLTNLSQEEKDKRTSEMKSHFKSMFGKTNIAPSGGVGKVQIW